MPLFPERRHIPHQEIPGGTVCITWRLHRQQALLSPSERDVVLAAILRCEEGFAQLLAGVVMDDHAHVLVRPTSGVTAKRLAAAWKGVSAHQLCGPGRRSSPLWQREYFDRWMASAEQTDHCLRYIRQNPERRWVGITDYRWLVVPGDRRSPPAET